MNKKRKKVEDEETMVEDEKTILKIELKNGKESLEKYNQWKEERKYFEELMKSSNYLMGQDIHELRKENHQGMEKWEMQSQRTNQLAMEKLFILWISIKENMACKIINLSLLVTIFTTRNTVIKYMSVGQNWEMHLQHLDLKDIATTINLWT